MQNEAVLLKKAIMQGIGERYAQELSESKQNAAYSDTHAQKMSHILGFDVQSLHKRNRRKMIAAAILLAAALVVGSLTAYAYRDLIREFFVQVFEEYIIIQFPGEQPSQPITEIYEFGYIPEKFVMTKEEVYLVGVKYEFVDPDNNTFVFEQMSIGTEIRLDGDDGYTTMITHNDLEIYCRHYEHSSHYVWNDGKYVMMIGDNTQLPLEEILRMIDSITSTPISQ